MPNRPVALIPISQHFSIRYFLLTGIVQQLQSQLECVLALAWRDDALEDQLRQQGLRWVYLPELKLKPGYRLVRSWLNAMQEDDMASPTPAIDRRRARVMQHSLRERLFYLRSDLRRHLASGIGSTTLGRRAIERLERNSFSAGANWQAFANVIGQVRPAIIISSTPFLSAEAILCRVAQRMGIKTIATMLSFDNLTSRGKIETTFDHYSVWNAYMKREAMRIYGVAPEQVAVDGAPQMDFYAWPDILYPRQEFLDRFGLDPARPVILFGAGPAQIAPAEPHALVQLDRIVDSYPRDRRPHILLRLHPVDGRERWDDAISRCQHVVVAPAWQVKEQRAGRITLEDIRVLATTLAYTDVHISTSSTMSLDGAIFDKPQICLAYDDRPGRPFDRAMVELYEREHFLPLVESGGIQIVRSPDALADILKRYLEDPALDQQARASMVRSVCSVAIGDAAASVAATILRCLEPLPTATQQRAQSQVDGAGMYEVLHG